MVPLKVRGTGGSPETSTVELGAETLTSTPGSGTSTSAACDRTRNTQWNGRNYLRKCTGGGIGNVSYGKQKAINRSSAA